MVGFYSYFFCSCEKKQRGRPSGISPIGQRLKIRNEKRKISIKRRSDDLKQNPHISDRFLIFLC